MKRFLRCLGAFSACVIFIAIGFMGSVHPVHAAGLSAVNVEPASLVAGVTGSVTVTFTTTTSIPADGKIFIGFGAGFDITGATSGTCSTMDGTFTTSLWGGVGPVSINRVGDGTIQTADVETCTFSGIKNPAISGSTGVYSIEITDNVEGALDNDYSVAADTITPGDLGGTNVEPGNLVAGSAPTVNIDFITANPIPANGKIKITFGANFNVSGATSAQCSGTMDGTFATSVVDQTVTITRQGDGTSEPAGTQGCAIGGIVNPSFSGSTGTYAISTTTSADVLIDQRSVVPEDTITVGALSSTNVAPATLVAGASGTTTVTFTTANAIPANGVMKITFGSGFDVSGAASGTCSSQDGTFVTTVSGQVVTLTRQGDGTSEPAGAQTCTIGTIVNPAVSGTTGTYTIATFLTGGSTGIDIDAAVGADTITVGALSSTNVAPATLMTGTTNTVTVSFTTTNAIPSTGKIKVTFGSGFNVASAASGTCSTMDGSFATSVSGQVVTITRSAGASEPAGAQTCTIGAISNPSTVGSTGTYTITTTNTSDVSIDTDTAVTADSITRSSSSSSSPAALTYDIQITAPIVSSVYAGGELMTISWSTAASTGTVGAINLAYSTDATTYTTIVSGASNGGSYVWTVPDIQSESVTIRAEATDLLTVLDTATSGVFTIGATSTTTTDTEETIPLSTDTNLSEGAYIKSPSWTTVYFVDADGLRRPFLDAQTFFTYADSFDEVVAVSDETLSNYTLGTPMLAQAGTVLVKIQSMNQVYAVTDVDGIQTLRWITTEELAQSLFGADWADYVIDVPPTAWPHFVVGEPIDASADITVDIESMRTREVLASM